MSWYRKDCDKVFIKELYIGIRNCAGSESIKNIFFSILQMGQQTPKISFHLHAQQVSAYQNSLIFPTSIPFTCREST